MRRKKKMNKKKKEKKEKGRERKKRTKFYLKDEAFGRSCSQYFRIFIYYEYFF